MDATEAALEAYKAERKQENEERTPEEAEASLQWLRDHGVEVESVEVYHVMLHHSHVLARIVSFLARRPNQ